jgi:peroxiredoxin
MQQVVDLQNDPEFRALDIALLSIAFDSPAVQKPEADAMGITVPMLSDATHEISERFGVLRWAVATGEPGHTFVLLNRDGRVVWTQDYGAPENGGRMYVPVGELVAQIRQTLGQ